MAKARSASAPLGFRLALDDGRAVLELPEGTAAGLARVQALRLEVPELRYPFDLAQGMARFQSRRCLLRELSVGLEAEKVSAWLAALPLARYGLHDPWLAVGPDGLRLLLRAELGGRSATVTARLVLAGRPGGRLTLDLAGARAYGFLPVPAPLVLAGLFAAMGIPALPASGVSPPPPGSDGAAAWWARPPALLASRGTTGLQVAALDLVLYPLLTGHGWRLPDRRAVELAQSELHHDGGAELRLSFRNGAADGQAQATGQATRSASEPTGSLAASRAADLLGLGEEALAAGELRAAREIYRHAAAGSPAGPAEDRLLALLLASPDSREAAEELVQARLARQPQDPEALLAQGVLASESGRPGEGAVLLERAAEFWQRAGESVEAAAALHAASQLRAGEGDGAGAQATLGRALAIFAEQASPLRQRWAEQLVGFAAAPAIPEELARARARWREGDLAAAAQDFEALLGGRSASRSDPDPAAEAHLRLAQWARLNGQLMVASRHLGQATKLESGGGAPLEVLVEVLEAFGKVDDLEAALVRRRKRAPLGGSEARAVTGALAGVLERAGRAPEAAPLYQQLLAERPDDLPTLRQVAELYRREGQRAELTGVLEHQFALGQNRPPGWPPSEDIDLEAVGLELAQLYEDGQGSRDRAAAVLEQLCAARPDSREAREALVALDRRPPGAED